MWSPYPASSPAQSATQSAPSAAPYRQNPYQGTELSPGIRKIRFTIDSKGRGKSGGARVITFTYLVNEKDGVVILLLLYDKADASSIRMNVVRKIIKDLGLDLAKLQLEGSLKVTGQTQ